MCRTEFVYLDDNSQLQSSSQTSTELLGQSYTTDPGDLGVPNGATTWMKIWVMWGTDNQVSQAFTYTKGNNKTANYTCSGTTLSNHLALDNVS